MARRVRFPHLVKVGAKSVAAGGRGRSAGRRTRGDRVRAEGYLARRQRGNRSAGLAAGAKVASRHMAVGQPKPLLVRRTAQNGNLLPAADLSNGARSHGRSGTNVDTGSGAQFFGSKKRATAIAGLFLVHGRRRSVKVTASVDLVEGNLGGIILAAARRALPALLQVHTVAARLGDNHRTAQPLGLVKTPAIGVDAKVASVRALAAGIIDRLDAINATPDRAHAARIAPERL